MDRKDRLPALALSVCLALVACSGDDQSADTLAPVITSTTAATTTTAPATTAATTTTAPATTAPASTPPTTPPPPPTEAPTTTAAPTTSAAATTAAPPPTTPPAPTLALRQDGLGVAAFGTDADAAVAAVTAALGEPSEDTGWVEPVTISSCSGTELRRVSWGVLSLYLGDPSGGGARQLFAYSYGNVADLGGQPAGLTTPEGIGLGDPVADLRAAYPTVEIIPGEEGLIEPGFYVSDDLGGLLTGDSDADSVTVVLGGSFCG